GEWSRRAAKSRTFRAFRPEVRQGASSTPARLWCLFACRGNCGRVSMRRRDWRGGSGPGRPTGGAFRRGLSAAAAAAIIVTVLTFALGARPLSTYSPFDSGSPSTALVRKAVIYAKEGSRKLIDGR